MKELNQTYTKLHSFYNNYKIFESLFNDTGSVIGLQNKLDIVQKAPISVLKSGLTAIKKNWSMVLDELHYLRNRNEVNVEEQVKALIKELTSLFEPWNKFVEKPLKVVSKSSR